MTDKLYVCNNREIKVPRILNVGFVRKEIKVTQIPEKNCDTVCHTRIRCTPEGSYDSENRVAGDKVQFLR